jgi:hypothetical protein
MREDTIGERDVITEIGERVGHGIPHFCFLSGMIDASKHQRGRKRKFFAWIFVTILIIDRQVIDDSRLEFRRQISATGAPLYKHS